MSDPKNMFWDSCVFIRYLIQTPTEFLYDIGEFIRDAVKGDRKIYYSTIIYAEIKPSHLKKRGYESIEDFIKDFEGAFEPIDPNPNILADVGIMRDLLPEHPVKTAKLKLGTPDAIHLASCVYVRDTLGASDIVFHTFDATPGNGWEGKTVPIIGIEQWYTKHMSIRQISDACKLLRTQPQYPQTGLFAPTPGAGDKPSLPPPTPEAPSTP